MNTLIQIAQYYPKWQGDNKTIRGTIRAKMTIRPGKGQLDLR